MAKRRSLRRRRHRVLLALECELWQSATTCSPECKRVLLALECELWQSRRRMRVRRARVLLALECELWQSQRGAILQQRRVLLALECELWQSDEQFRLHFPESCWPWNVNCGKASSWRTASRRSSCWPWNVNCGKAFPVSLITFKGLVGLGM